MQGIKLYSLPLLLLLFAGCASDGFYAGTQGPSRILARDDEFVVLQVGRDDARSLAKRFLGDAGRYWVIEDANAPRPIVPGRQIIIPLKEHNPGSFAIHGYQTVPILCYHRFGEHSDRLDVSAAQFREQLNYLKENDYRVIPLADLVGFLRGERSLPKRAVVLTIDDGHRSIYQVAYPMLKEFGYPATLFIYSDYIESGGLRWREIDEMSKSGLISIQSHSKSHDNLAVKVPGETEAQYRRRLRTEVNVPTDLMRRHLGRKVAFYAYPYGDANPQVIKELRANGLHLGLTVQPQANAAFSPPYLLRRTMIFGQRGLHSFKSALKTFKALDDS